MRSTHLMIDTGHSQIQKITQQPFPTTLPSAVTEIPTYTNALLSSRQHMKRTIKRLYSSQDLNPGLLALSTDEPPSRHSHLLNSVDDNL